MATQTAEPLPLKALCAKHKLPLRLTRRRLRRLSKAKKLSHKPTMRWEFTPSEFAALIKRLEEEQPTPAKAKPTKKASAAKASAAAKRKAPGKKPKATTPSSPEPATPAQVTEPAAQPAAN